MVRLVPRHRDFAGYAKPAGTQQYHSGRVLALSLSSVAAVAFACVLTLLTPALAQAAMYVRMSVEPASPVVGQPAYVVVKTVYLSGAACLDDPNAEEHPFVAFAPRRPYQTFDLVATGPNGAADVRFEINQSAADPTNWAGPITFPTPGHWTLSMIRPDFSGAPPRCSGAGLHVTVLPNSRAAAWRAEHGRTVGLLATVILLCSGIAFGVWKTNRRRSRPI